MKNISEKTYKEFIYYMKQKRKYKNIFSSFGQIKKTKTINFINKYHKRPSKYLHKVAYLAGLIDGEGYFKTEKHKTLRLIIGMCDKKTIYWIRKNFGGNISLQYTQKGRKFYVWRMNQGKDLFYLLLLLIPFLVNKKIVALNFFKNILGKLEKMQHILYPHLILGIRKDGQ